MHIRSRNRNRSRYGGDFFPGRLFLSGAQGAWYDPSDFSTLYQDAAGTTPVTAVEQPVRLMLDKSKGLVLGSELITNGTFDANITGWTNASTGTGTATWNAGGASLVRIDAGNAGILRQSFTTVAGRSYRISYSAATATIKGGVGTSALDDSLSNTSATAGTTTAAIFVASGTTTHVYFIPVANATTAVLDNVSIRELPGNHAVAPNDASRPVLRARYNLLTRTEEFDDAVWNKVAQPGGTALAPVVTANADLAPDGTTTADSILFDRGAGNTSSDRSILRQSFTITATGDYTGTIYLKAATAGDVGKQLVFRHVGAAAYLVITLTADWVRYTRIETTSVTGSKMFEIENRGNITADKTVTALVWGAQLLTAADKTATGGAYQRVGAATDYNTGPPWRPYLAFDGSDDSMSTSSIDFSGTDKMTVFAGVTKLSDAAAGVVLGHGADFSAVGAFEWQANTGANATTAFRGRSSAGSTANAGFFRNVAAPSTFVFASLVDYAAAAGAEFSGRYNGVVQVQNDGLLQENTGTFGSNVLTIGSRQGGASQRFNGRLYGLTVLGRTATTSELSAMESWIAGKTGVTI